MSISVRQSQEKRVGSLFLAEEDVSQVKVVGIFGCCCHQLGTNCDRGEHFSFFSRLIPDGGGDLLGKVSSDCTMQLIHKVSGQNNRKDRAKYFF